MTVRKGSDEAGLVCVCADQMDGSYLCDLSAAGWITRREDFAFHLVADSEDFVPVRTLVDPTCADDTLV